VRICLTAPEFFVAGNYGGFGAVVRKLAYELSMRGISTCVLVPRNGFLQPIEQVDGYVVVSYPGGAFTGLENARRFSILPEIIDAEVFHSQEPSVATCLAQIGCPSRKHIVTLQAPATAEDWEKLWVGREIPEDGKRRFLQAYRNEVGSAVISADRVFVQSGHVVEKSMKLYDLTEPPEIMHNPVDVPEREPVKSRTPVVCLLGRWDPIKRPELFMQLAQRFPKVNFVAMGGCNSDGIEREQLLQANLFEFWKSIIARVGVWPG
jgi:glycosyltransferase involved in cell wall biosynthesis